MKIGFWVVDAANVDGLFAVVVSTVVVVVHDGLWVTEPTLKNKMLRLSFVSFY